ncbi:MAG TPA: hypothetical protein VNF47_14560 [Streptosporangiaceae bacterium]|nr:hypothetical protein [Streptosporangiaceae bacterium]
MPGRTTASRQAFPWRQRRQPGAVTAWLAAAAWLGPRVHRASGVTVREAVKPGPAELREHLLGGYRDKRAVHFGEPRRS